MYKCLEDNVLVLPMPNSDSKTDGGIVVPGKVRNRPIIGTVLAIGPGQKLEDGTRFPETLKVGSEVVFPAKSGDSVYLDGQDFIIIPSRYILMVISEPDNNNDSVVGYTLEDGEPIDIDGNRDIVAKSEEDSLKQPSPLKDVDSFASGGTIEEKTCKT